MVSVAWTWLRGAIDDARDPRDACGGSGTIGDGATYRGLGQLTQEKREGCGASRIVETGKPTAREVRARGTEDACEWVVRWVVASPFGF